MLNDFLKKNKDAILRDWQNQTINTYKPEMIRFLKKEKNQFSNPVRNTIITSLEKIYDGILSDNDVDNTGLEEIIKVRAIQNFSPSEALSFIFGFKKLIRTELLKSEQKTGLLEELSAFDQKVDVLLRHAFDYYNECRSKINDIKLSEIKARLERAFEILQKRKPQRTQTKSL